MLIACGKVDITPTEELVVAGYLDRQSVHEPTMQSRLEANFVVFSSSQGVYVLLSLDTLFSSEQFRQSLISHLGVNSRFASVQIGIVASHTHNAPSLDSEKPLLGVVDESYFRACVERIADAILSLSISVYTEVSALSEGKADCMAGVYRRATRIHRPSRKILPRKSIVMAPDPKVDIPRQLKICLLHDRDNQPLACLWSWPCHPTSIGNRDLVSADFPGVVRCEIRRYLGCGALPVLYLPGFCGDISPFIKTERKTLKQYTSMPFGDLFELSSASSYSGFCSSVVNAMRTALNNVVVRSISDRSLELESRSVGVEELFVGQGLADTLSITVLKLLGIEFLFINAEVCSQYLKLYNFERFAFVSGYYNSCVSYIPTDAQIEEGGYEVHGFLSAFSAKGRFEKSIENKIVELIAIGEV